MAGQRVGSSVDEGRASIRKSRTPLFGDMADEDAAILNAQRNPPLKFDGNSLPVHAGYREQAACTNLTSDVEETVDVQWFVMINTDGAGRNCCFSQIPHRRCRPRRDETGVLQLSFVLLNLHFCFFLVFHRCCRPTGG